MPFWVLYRFSDTLYFLLYKIGGYRKSTVRKNLQNSFPDKSELERKTIEKLFYKHLFDILLEGIKGFSLKKEQLIKRYKVSNPEILDPFIANSRNLLVLGCHYGNWEWGPISANYQINPQIICLYKTIKNPYIDNYIRAKREAAQTILKPITETAITFEKYNSFSTTFILLADQSPSNIKDCHWVTFLGRETAVLHGPAKYSQKYNLPIGFMYLEKAKRGHYKITVKILTENPRKIKPNEISILYMQELEKMIEKRPELWLWSHKRWKKKRNNI